MLYYKPKVEAEKFWLEERIFDLRYQLKTESIMSTCNGYMGVRAATEVKSLEQSRGHFVAGFFHQAGEYEVTELVNCPDLLEMDIYFNGEKFNLETCTIHSFTRRLDVWTGELEIQVDFDLPSIKQISFCSRRFVSRSYLPLLVHQIEIQVADLSYSQANPIVVKCKTGINGQITNSGVSHFHKVEARVFEKSQMYLENLCDDGQILALWSQCKGAKATAFTLKRRSIWGEYQGKMVPGEKFCFSKMSLVHHYMSVSDREQALKSVADSPSEKLVKFTEAGYDSLYETHRKVCQIFWQRARIEIQGIDLEEEAAILYAQYQLWGMTPTHSQHISVGAKGLSGEGYKGHVFWDTEMFILPFFIYTSPRVARDLLIFRYQGLEGARAKAIANGYQGAMYPWEVARSGREETPLWAALNIHTGVATKIWSGIKEHHVTADIAYAIKHYYQVTEDESFLLDYGYEMIFETAIFWLSRSCFRLDTKQWEILDIIGPDEYTEHIDNNAYTNYLVKQNIDLALWSISHLTQKYPEQWAIFNQTYDLKRWQTIWQDYSQNIYLPEPNQAGIIPQDDSFLQKPNMPQIEKYRNSPLKQSVLLDYSRQEIIDHQVLKQADVVMLLNLGVAKFPWEIVKKNVDYYEARTIHDSSLSYCAHTMACALIEENAKAYDFFLKSLQVDLDPNDQDSQDGIHAAALGGIWNSLVLGFAGISVKNRKLVVQPRLPEQWQKLRLRVQVAQTLWLVEITHQQVNVQEIEDVTEDLAGDLANTLAVK